MKTKLFILAFSWARACCLPAAGQMHPELKPYHDRFAAEAQNRGNGLTGKSAPIMEFAYAGMGERYGRCEPDGRVRISRNCWDGASEAQREMAVFHELAHYYLNCGHVPHRPHIMNTSECSPVTYTVNRDKMLDELFQLLRTAGGNLMRLNIEAGDLVVCSDSIHAATFRLRRMNAASAAALSDSLRNAYECVDLINKDAYLVKTERYNVIIPVVPGRIAEVRSVFGKMYLFSEKAAAPRIDASGQILWNGADAMCLSVDYKPKRVKIGKNINILYFIRKKS